MTKRIVSFLVVALLTACPSVVFAKKYSIKDCEDTTKKLATAVLSNIAPKAPTEVYIQPPKKGSRTLAVSGKTIPTAYLVEFKENTSAPRETYITKEVQKIFDDTPMQTLGEVRCPRDTKNKKEMKLYKDSLSAFTNSLDTYIKQNMITTVFKDFMRTFINFYADSREGFANEVGGILPAGHVFQTMWGVQERYTNYSFKNIHLVFDYCAYFTNSNESNTPNQLEQKKKDCLAKESKRFEFTVSVKDRSGEEISNELASYAKSLNTAMYMHFRMLVAKEAKKSI